MSGPRQVETIHAGSLDTAAIAQMGREADAVLRLGQMMLATGTGGYRVIRGMKRAARALKFDGLDAQVAFNSITCTFHRGDAFRTMVTVLPSPGVNASKLEVLEDLTHNFDAEYTVARLNASLDAIEAQQGHRWPRWLMIMAAGLACAAFAILNRFSLLESAIVFFGAAAGQGLRSFLAQKKFNQLGIVGASAAVASLVYYLITILIGLVTDVSITAISAGYVASCLFLIPGFPLYSALLDMARFDFDAGLARLTYAGSVIMVATMSVAFVSSLVGIAPEPVVLPDPQPGWYAAAAVASAVGIAGFAILFNSSKRMIVIAAGIGTLGNLVRLVVWYLLGWQPQYAALVGGLVIGLLAAIISRPANIPRITMTVPAAVIMVPGAAMYRAIYYVNSGEMIVALSHATSAALSIISIVGGLAIARMLSDPDWAFGRYIDFEKTLPAPKNFSA